MGEAYDLRSNIKDKPGSQGTLFQVTDKGLLNPGLRWPRGYSPERQAEVADALKDTPVKGKDGADGHQRARVVGAVARSTMPVDHLKGLASIGPDIKKGSEGTYWPARHHLAVNMLDPKFETNDAAGQTLLHELGHHRDSMVPPALSPARKITEVAAEHAKKTWPHEGEPNTTAKLMAEREVSSGVQEATADNYMTEHYRTPGRKPQPVTEGKYEQNFAPNTRATQYPGYNDVRPPLQGRQFHPEVTQSMLRVTPTGNVRLP